MSTVRFLISRHDVKLIVNGLVHTLPAGSMTATSSDATMDAQGPVVSHDFHACDLQALYPDVVDLLDRRPLGVFHRQAARTLILEPSMVDVAMALQDVDRMAMLRFCEHPEIMEALRADPSRIPDAVEELLRLDGSFICIGRTARHDTELGGRPVKRGERVMIYWASANRDDGEFDHPDELDLDRSANRHIAFGAGPHRCAGSNLARMNLRIAFEELVARLHDVRLQPGAHIEYHSAMNRAPVAVPITFTLAPRSS